jgi:hypothetical protein
MLRRLHRAETPSSHWSPLRAISAPNALTALWTRTPVRLRDRVDFGAQPVGVQGQWETDELAG